MDLKFKCGSELIYLKIDRKNNKLEMSNSKTNYSFYPIPYSELFGIKGTKESIDLQKDIGKKSGKEFKIYLTKEFAKKGYVNVPC